MMNNDEQQVIALAATVQALTTVNEIATKGRFDEYQAVSTLQALVTYSPEDTLAAYGGKISVLRSGINQLKHMFSDNLDRDIAQYLLTIVSVELKLMRDNNMRYKLKNGLQNTVDNFGDGATDDEQTFTDQDFHDYLTKPETIASFADIYKQTASQVEPRVMIKGNHQNLQNEDSANQIRALLLAALRGAAFFRHYGGKRIDFMMKRKQFLAIAEKLSG